MVLFSNEKIILMQTLTVNIKNKNITSKVLSMLKSFETEVEISSIEDMDDLKLLKQSRQDDSVDFSDYLANEN